MKIIICGAGQVGWQIALLVVAGVAVLFGLGILLAFASCRRGIGKGGRRILAQLAVALAATTAPTAHPMKVVGIVTARISR